MAAGATIWGTIGVAGKSLFSHGLDPMLVASCRLSVAFLSMLAYVALFRRDLFRVRAADLLLFAGFGVVSVGLYNFFYLTAIHLTTASTAVVLLYTAPFFAVVVSVVLFKERFGPVEVSGLILAVAGTFLCVGGLSVLRGAANPAGILAGLGSGLTYGLFGVFGKRGIERYDYRTVLVYSLGFGAAFLGLWRSPWSVLGGSLPAPVWAALVYLALGPTVASYCLYHVGLEYTGAGRASVISTVEVVVALVLGRFVLGEILSPAQVGGALMVLGGVALIQMRAGDPYGHSGDHPAETGVSL